MRFGSLVALPLFVMVLALLVPICKPAFAAAGGSGYATVTSRQEMKASPLESGQPGAHCCSYLGDDFLMSPPTGPFSQCVEDTVGTASVAHPGIDQGGNAPLQVRRVLSPPPKRSYYARSARILR